MADATSMSVADQEARCRSYAAGGTPTAARYLDIDTVYDGSLLAGKRILITGANRGIGLALAKEAVSQGAHVIGTCRKPSEEMTALGIQIVDGVDVTEAAGVERMAGVVASDGPVDILLNNAGYFYKPVETLDTLAFEEEKKMIDICALGPLRVTAALRTAGALKSGSKVVVITSQGGSVSWRFVQNPTGHDYGHHMSKAAANMAAVLLSQELKGEGVAVGILHPGFNTTDMTAKYADEFESNGAVDPAIGAKRVLHEANVLTMETSGRFINAEDGLTIPW